MRRLMLLAGLALAVGVLLAGSAAADVGGSDLPFKGSQSGLSTANLLTGEVHLVTSGPTSHFGLTMFEQDIQLVPAGPGIFNWLGTWTAAAASGDQMVGTSTGTVTFAADGIHSTQLGTYTSSGGTGRFADAALTFDSTGQGTRLSLDGAIATSFWEVMATGTLSY